MFWKFHIPLRFDQKLLFQWTLGKCGQIAKSNQCLLFCICFSSFWQKSSNHCVLFFLCHLVSQMHLPKARRCPTKVPRVFIQNFSLYNWARRRKRHQDCCKPASLRKRWVWVHYQIIRGNASVCANWVCTHSLLLAGRWWLIGKLKRSTRTYKLKTDRRDHYLMSIHVAFDGECFRTEACKPYTNQANIFSVLHRLPSEPLFTWIGTAWLTLTWTTLYGNSWLYSTCHTLDSALDSQKHKEASYANVMPKLEAFSSLS